MAFDLPELPYNYDQLQPYIDAQTMEIHHSKHHAGYTSKLNDAIKKTVYDKKNIEEILSNIDNVSEGLKTTIRNNGGGYYNHKLFWEWMTPGGSEISSEFKKILGEQFGGVEEFKEIFSSTAASRFGSGRAWLVKHDDQLEVYSTPNQDSPIMEGKTPILGIDVREHAYYLHYQNKRPDYIEAWRNVVNRAKVEEMYHNYEI